MSLARLMGVKSALVAATLLLGACVSVSRRPVMAPEPTVARRTEPHSHLPPLKLPGDSALSSDTTVATQVADLPVTVLPTIIGHRTSKSDDGEPPAGGISRDGNDQTVRIAIALRTYSARIQATGDWSIYDGPGDKVLVRLHAGDSFTVRVRNGMLASADGLHGTVAGPLIARPDDAAAFVEYGGHRYRGELGIAATSDGVSVINRVGVEDYLRGVVPLEIGTDRTLTESAAVEAQAIAARSYTYTRMNDSRPYDMVATTNDQMYGGVDAECPLSDAAVMATRNMVMMYDGKVINAPYHANSGGTTASASEVWRGGDEPYLISVSDRIPGTDHYYGEDSPRFHWTRTLNRTQLASLLKRYLPQYGGAPSGAVGTLQKITETGRTLSGRVAGLVFVTSRGRYTVRGDNIRFVLRGSGGAILPSTLFTFDVDRDRKGRVTKLTISGNGNGHGVGMDQWGAIARARAGQDAMTILHTYYPGTTIGRVI